jgi:hypothetical protein
VGGGTDLGFDYLFKLFKEEVKPAPAQKRTENQKYQIIEEDRTALTTEATAKETTPSGPPKAEAVAKEPSPSGPPKAEAVAKEPVPSEPPKAEVAREEPKPEVRGTYAAIKGICDHPKLISETPLGVTSDFLQRKLAKFFEFKPLKARPLGFDCVEGKRWYARGGGKILISHDPDGKIRQTSIWMGLTSKHPEKLKQQNIRIVCKFLEVVVPGWPAQESEKWVERNLEKSLAVPTKLADEPKLIGKAKRVVGDTRIQFFYESHRSGGTIVIDVDDKNSYYTCSG